MSGLKLGDIEPTKCEPRQRLSRVDSHLAAGVDTASDWVGEAPVDPHECPERALESQAINLRKESAIIDCLIACDRTAPIGAIHAHPGEFESSG